MKQQRRWLKSSSSNNYGRLRKLWLQSDSRNNDGITKQENLGHYKAVHSDLFTMTDDHAGCIDFDVSTFQTRIIFGE